MSYVLQTTVMSSISDVRDTVVSQQHNSIKTNTNQAKSTPTTAMPVAVFVSSQRNSTSTSTRHVPASIATVSSCASTDIASALNGTSSLSQLTYTGAAPVSTSDVGPTSPATGTGPVSTATSSRSTDPSSAFISTGIAASTGFTSGSSQPTSALSITGSVATSTVTTPDCKLSISKPCSAVPSGSRSHSGLISSMPVQVSNATPHVTHTILPTEPQELQHLPLPNTTPQASLTQNPVSPPTASLCSASPTTTLSLTSSTTLQAQSSPSTNYPSTSSPSATAVRKDFFTPSLNVEGNA